MLNVRYRTARQERIVTGIMRAPEVLGVDSALLQAKAAYLQSPSTYSPQGSSPLQGGGGPGLSGLDVAALFVRDPASLLASLTRLRETVDWLRCVDALTGLGCEPAAALGCCACRCYMAQM